MMINYTNSDQIWHAKKNIQGNNAAFQEPIWINVCMKPWEGHLSFWQYITLNRHQCGINLLLSGMKSVLILDFIVHSDIGIQV
jgi:hypothetical protein